MAWLHIDDQFPVHPTIQCLTDNAFRLYVSALCWCNLHRRGLVPEEQLPYISDARRPDLAARELAMAGLWQLIDGGWLIPDYPEEYQPSPAQAQQPLAAESR